MWSAYYLPRLWLQLNFHWVLDSVFDNLENAKMDIFHHFEQKVKNARRGEGGGVNCLFCEITKIFNPEITNDYVPFQAKVDLSEILVTFMK